MKLLLFVDTHGDLEAMELIKAKASLVDAVLCAGDITIWGNNIGRMIRFLDSLGKPIFIVHGNHETKDEMLKACKDRKNVKFIHEQVVSFKGLKIIGFGGGGFSSRSQKFESWSKELLKESHENSILLTHTPPFNTKLDVVWDANHAGNKSFAEFIEKTRPLLVVSGHIHETWGETDRIGRTIIINPGPEGIVVEV